MNFEFAISVLLMFSAACYFALGMRMVLAKREVGTMPIGVLFLVISVWVVGGSIELLTDDFVVFSIGRTMHFFGTALLPVAAYFCFREYTGRKTSMRRSERSFRVRRYSGCGAAGPTHVGHPPAQLHPAISERARPSSVA